MKDLSGFDALTRVGVVANLAKKVARTVAGYPVDVANEALTLARRDTTAVPDAAPAGDVGQSD